MAYLRGGSLGQRVRYGLVGLEDKDLEQQATWGLRSIIGQSKSAKDVKLIIKDLLTGLDSASASARRHRYLLAGYAVEGCPTDIVPHIVPLIMTKVNRQLGEEKQQPIILAVAQMVEKSVERLMLHMVEVMNGKTDDSSEFSKEWLTNTLVQALIRAAAKSPDKNKVVMAFVVLHGVLSVLRDWTRVPGVVPTVLYSFKHAVQAMLHGLFGCRVADAYRPLQRCMEILGAHAPPETVGMAMKVCIVGAKDKDDWQVRKSAMETLTVIAAAVQIHEKSEQREWALKMPDGLFLLIQKKPEIFKVLSNAKYDKNIHVRKVAAAAKVEMDNIPDPSPGRVPNVMQGSMPARHRADARRSHRRSISFDSRPSSSKSILRSRSCDVASVVPPIAPQRKQKSKRDSRSMDLRRSTSANVERRRSSSGPEESAVSPVGGEAQKQAHEAREKRATERKARMEDLRVQLRRAKSAKPFSGHDGQGYEVHALAPARQRNHFDVSALDSDQRCPSAPPLTPTEELEGPSSKLPAEGPDCMEAESCQAQGRLNMHIDEGLAAWVSGVESRQELGPKVSVGGKVGQRYRYMAPPMLDCNESSASTAMLSHMGQARISPNGDGHRCRSQASFEELILLPPAVMNCGAGSIRPSTSNGSAISSTMATLLLDGSEPASPRSDATPLLELASPAGSVGSSSPLHHPDDFLPSTGDSAEKIPSKGVRQSTTGKDHNLGRRQAYHGRAKADREFCQVQLSPDDAIVRDEGAVQSNGKNGLVPQAKVDVALLTQGSTNNPETVSPKIRNAPMQVAAVQDKGRDAPLLSSSAKLAGATVSKEGTSGRVNPDAQFAGYGRNASRDAHMDLNVMRCSSSVAGAVLEHGTSDIAEKLDALDTISESSIDIESPGRRSGRWRKSLAPPRSNARPTYASPEQMLDYTIATLKQCMHDLPKAGKEKRRVSPRAAAESFHKDVGGPGCTAHPVVGPEPSTCQEEPSALSSPSAVPEGEQINEPAMLAHADGVLQYYKARESIQLKFLEEQYQRNVANMEAMFEREKAFLRNATQKAINEEVGLFSRTYVPHIASVPSEIDAQQSPQGGTTHIR